ncbi:MAG: hypothetical protein LBS89_00315 [Zoogloeaceae bacterium]|jgi:hypothetical protein|nr:hypothetical protein [Zoogloeaceae bacterium]
MLFRKLLAFLLSLCLTLAAVTSGVMMPAEVGAMPEAPAASHAASPSGSCHAALSTPAAEPADALPASDTKAAPVTHACCVNFVALPPPLRVEPAAPARSEPIAFTPPFALSACVQGIYRPPRLFA